MMSWPVWLGLGQGRLPALVGREISDMSTTQGALDESMVYW